MSYIGNEPIVSATRTITEVTATAGQTVFNANGGYTLGYIDVFLNGAQLQTVDFTATNGSTITLTEAAQVGDVLKLVAWGTFSTSTAVLRAGDTMTGALLLPDGSASAPALSNDGDTNTGIFFPAADTIAFAEGGTEVMRIDSAGRVTIPNQPCFSGYYNGAALGPNNVPTKLSLTEITNNGSYYSSGNFTAPVAGYYYCTFMGATIYGTSGALDISIRKNGSLVTGGYAFSSNINEYNAGGCNAVVYCSANDTIEFWKNSTSTNSFEAGQNYSSASIMLIG